MLIPVLSIVALRRFGRDRRGSAAVEFAIVAPIFFALIFAITMIVGLMLSLTIKRRRVWYRITPGVDGGRTVVEIGGLARTDQAGYGAEFESMVALVPTDGEQSPP